jgi:hypothetical protein
MGAGFNNNGGAFFLNKEQEDQIILLLQRIKAAQNTIAERLGGMVNNELKKNFAHILSLNF